MRLVSLALAGLLIAAQQSPTPESSPAVSPSPSPSPMAPALATPSPKPNPLVWGSIADPCPAEAAVVPWNSKTHDMAMTTVSDTFMVHVWSAATQNLNAHVLLYSTTATYSVDIASSHFVAQSSKSKRQTTIPVPVTFDQPLDIKYVSIDSVQIDDAAAQTCPVQLLTVASYNLKAKPTMTMDDPPQSMPTVREALGTYSGPALHATVVAPLDPTCPRMYQPPTVQHIDATTVGSYPHAYQLDGNYGVNDVRSTVMALVDTSGNVTGAYVVFPSHNAAFDAAALQAALHATFAPAQILCKPALSKYELFFSY